MGKMGWKLRTAGICALVVYGVSVYGANWLIRHVGPMVLPDGSHLVPVAFGLGGVMAPSGTYAAGLTLVARDVVQRTIGRRWSLVVILPGALLTALLDVQLALASACAFLFGELADYLVYTPMAQRRFVVAVVASVLAGSVVDSVLFLGIAGIPLAVALPGLLVGKAEVAAVVAPVAYLLRRWMGSWERAPVVTGTLPAARP